MCKQSLKGSARFYEQLAKGRGKCQERLAEWAEIDRTYVSMIERGRGILP